MPALRAAAKALENIKKSDITDLKSIKVFNDDVRMVLSAVCILMDVKPENKLDPATQQRKIIYDDNAKKKLGEMDFL